MAKTVNIVCVLMVADDAERSNQLRELLAADPDSDFRLTTVERVDEALTLALQRSFDVLLIDVRCRDLDAPLSIANLRLAAAHQSLVILAADGYEKLTQRLLEVGALQAVTVTLSTPMFIGRDIRRVLARASTRDGGWAGWSQKDVRYTSNGGSGQSSGQTGGGGVKTDTVVRSREDIHVHGDVYAPAAREFASTFDRLGHDQTLEALERLASGIATDFEDSLSAISLRLEQLRGALDPDDPRLDDFVFLRKLTEQAMSLTHKLLDCAATAHTVTSRQGAPVLTRHTILVAEDESAVRKLARRILERAGYRVVEAVNAEEALEIAAAQPEPFALLLTDLMLPGMKGTQLAATLRIKQPDLPVICMSGYTQNTVPDNSGPAIECRFLDKPFTPTSLLDAVSAMVPRPAAHAPNAA